MMSLRTTLATLVVALALTTSSAARAEAKFGFLDVERALLETDEGRAAKVRLQGMLETKQKELDKEQEGLKKEKELLDKQASAMSEETRNQKGLELQKKIYDMAQRWEKIKQDLAGRERQEMQSILAKMDPIIADIAHREGFTMILEKNAVVHANPGLDITDQLVRQYNVQNKPKAGGAAPVSPTPSTPKDAPRK